jgi:hypothetical protein
VIFFSRRIIFKYFVVILSLVGGAGADGFWDLKWIFLWVLGHSASIFGCLFGKSSIFYQNLKINL